MSRALSPRETQVLATIAGGLTEGQAARHLSVAVPTIHAHKARIFLKLGAKNGAEAVAIASEQGLLSRRCAVCGFSAPGCFCDLPKGPADPYELDHDPTSPDCPGCEVFPRECDDCRRCVSCCRCVKEE